MKRSALQHTGTPAGAGEETFLPGQLERLALLVQVLEPLWAPHPNWTLAEVCQQARVQHPEWFREVTP
jgi:hypothetical protein